MAKNVVAVASKAPAVKAVVAKATPAVAPSKLPVVAKAPVTSKAVAAAPKAVKAVKPAAAEQFSLAKHKSTMWIRILIAREPGIDHDTLAAQLKAGGLTIRDATLTTIRIDTQRTIDALRLAGVVIPAV